MVLVAVAVPNHAPAIDEPGALISTQAPELENPDLASLIIVDPTVIALGALAGDLVHASP